MTIIEKKIEIGEHIIALLDSAENTIKADYYGRLFKQYTQQKITVSEFERMSLIVKNLIVFDLNKLPIYKQEQRSLFYSASLHSNGLLVRVTGFKNEGDVDEDGYKLSSLGKKMMELLELENE